MSCNEPVVFVAEDWCDIVGRGRVAVVRMPEDGNPWEMFEGKIVEIDGEKYLVRGVEYWAITGVFKGALIGLLVRDLATDSSTC